MAQDYIYPEDLVARDPTFREVLRVFRDSDLSRIDVDSITDRIQEIAHLRNKDPLRKVAERGFGQANYAESMTKSSGKDNSYNDELLDYRMTLTKAKGFIDDLVTSAVSTYTALYRAEFKAAGNSVTEAQALVRDLLRDVIRYQASIHTAIEMIDVASKRLQDSHFSNRFCHDAYSRVAYDRMI